MKNIAIIMGFTFITLLFPLEEIIANTTNDYITTEYELVCELIEMENGELEWSCQIVPVTLGLDVSIAGTGGGGTTTQLYLVCWEHHENGMPTGETLAVRVSLM